MLLKMTLHKFYNLCWFFLPFHNHLVILSPNMTTDFLNFWIYWQDLECYLSRICFLFMINYTFAFIYFLIVCRILVSASSCTKGSVIEVFGLYTLRSMLLLFNGVMVFSQLFSVLFSVSCEEVVVCMFLFE